MTWRYFDCLKTFICNSIWEASTWISWKVWAIIRCIYTFNILVLLLPRIWRNWLSIHDWWWRLVDNHLLSKFRLGSYICVSASPIIVGVYWSAYSVPNLKKVLILDRLLGSEWFLEVLKVSWRKGSLRLRRHVIVNSVNLWSRLSLIVIYARKVLFIHDLIEAHIWLLLSLCINGVDDAYFGSGSLNLFLLLCELLMRSCYSYVGDSLLLSVQCPRSQIKNL